MASKACTLAPQSIKSVATIMLFVGILFFPASCNRTNDEYLSGLSEKTRLTPIFTRTPPVSMDSLNCLLHQYECKCDDHVLTLMYREMGTRERRSANISEAIRLHRLGLDAADRINDTLEMTQALNNMGIDFRRAGMHAEALSYHFRALHLAEIYHEKDNEINSNSRAIALNGIGHSSFAINHLDTAEVYFRKALDEIKPDQNFVEQANTYSNIGTIFEARRMHDSAMVYYQKAIKIGREMHNDRSIALNHLNIGNMLFDKGNYAQAEKEYLAAFHILEDVPDKWNWLNACLALAKLNIESNDPAEAIEYIRRAEDVAKAVNSDDHLTLAYNLMSRYDEMKGNYKSALSNYKLSRMYEDSVRQGQQLLNKIASTRVQYEKDKNEYSLNRLNNFYMSENQRKGSFIAFTIFVWILFILLLILLLQAIIMRMKNNRALRVFERMRGDFFAKITHEFRTPLTVVLGLSKQLKEQNVLPVHTTRPYLNAIERQGRTMLNLVNQLLDITRLRTVPDPIEWKTGNIIAYLEMIFEPFRLYAKDKEIDLVFYSEETNVETDFVPDYMNKVFQNLLSNAIKHSYAGDKVHLVIEPHRKHKNWLEIRVIDHGQGIDKKDIPYIFDLFFQTSSDTIKDGSGIGLTLAKQLVEILGGKISVSSKVGEGATFLVELPIKRNERQLFAYWLPTGDSTIEIKNDNAGDDDTDADYEELDTNPVMHGVPNGDVRTSVLLVEDNKDVALYIKSLLPVNRFNVVYSRNGEEALRIANEIIPDIVITDILMPVKDGLELCTEIRASELLNHVPVIMLTARNSFQNHIEGLRCGADAYICKPFRAEELQVRVDKLIESRSMLKEKYLRAMIKEEKSETNDASMNFLQRVTDIIYREMKNTDFGPRKLASELSLSISQLNKKLNATTGYPASNYILQIKIAYAKKILASNDITIGEAAARCGIFDVNYFARIFRKHTGVTPSQYQRMPRG